MSGAPLSLVEFQKRFASEEDCAAYLFPVRWPMAFSVRPAGAAGLGRTVASALSTNAPVAAARPR